MATSAHPSTARALLSRVRSAWVGSARDRERLRSLVVSVFEQLWPPRTYHVAAIFALGVLTIGLRTMVLQSSLPGRLPSPLDWRSAAALLERDSRPGDAVVLSPWWAERAREILPAHLPVFAFPRLEGEDLVGVRRVWLLSLPSAPGHSDITARDLASRATTEGSQRLGALALARYDLRQPTLPLAFLPDRIGAADVFVGDRKCTKTSGGRFRCQAPEFVEVVRQVREIDGLPRPCLFAHPAPGEELRIVFPSVPMGRILRGHTGIVGSAALDGKTPVRLSVLAGDRPVGTAEEPPATPGWHAFRFDTGEDAGKSLDLTFVIAAADVGRRHFCFDAFTLP